MQKYYICKYILVQKYISSIWSMLWFVYLVLLYTANDSSFSICFLIIMVLLLSSFFTTNAFLLLSIPPLQMHLASSSQAQWGPRLIRGPLTQGLSGLLPQCGAAAGSCTCSGSFTPLCSPPWRALWTRWCGSERTGMKRWEKERCWLGACQNMSLRVCFQQVRWWGKHATGGEQVGVNILCAMQPSQTEDGNLIFYFFSLWDWQQPYKTREE